MNSKRHFKFQISNFKFAICHSSGQAMVEMVFLIPLLMILAAGVIGVVYTCLQGIKVQQAANLVARIQGQERVAGGFSFQTIQQDNGVASNSGDADPTNLKLDSQSQNWRTLQKPTPPSGTVYAKIKDAVHNMFDPSDAPDLFVPEPKYGLVGYSDQVKVVRIWQPPSVFGWQLPPVTLDATAYGGEDSHMYGLVRWGSTSYNTLGNNSQFWSQRDGNSGARQNLQNPNND